MTQENEDIYRLAALLSDSGMDQDGIQTAVEHLLKALGEDPQREGLARTPERVANMYMEILDGYRQDPISLVNGALFEVNYDEMVVVRNIEFYSLCEHHLLPFFGHVNLAYLPNKRVLGLSKIPRIVDMFSHRLQVQEKMTRQIADFTNELLHPKGVAVVVEGLHLCASMRGVKKQDVRMTTSTMLGAFQNNLATREEFLNSISRGSNTLV